MKKVNLTNAVTVLAGACSCGMITVAGGCKNGWLIALACAAGATLAAVSISFDKTA